MKILLVDDSERLRRSLQHGLERWGFAVDAVGTGAEGLQYARHGGYDAIVLDLMLPGMDGLEVLRALRASGDATHVLILSAKDEVEERVEGLALGADDYLTKPFDFDELVARLRALIRRKFGTKDPVQRVGPVAVDTARREVCCAGTPVHLTRNEYAVLEYLVARRGRVVAKTELLAHLYAGDGQGSVNAVEVFVHQLRGKLESAGAPEVVRTRRGHGYIVE